MVLVTDMNLPDLLHQSGYNGMDFSIEVHVESLHGLLNRFLKGCRSAEIYCSSNSGWICDILRQNGIEPVQSVNKIQSGMKILQFYNNEFSILYDIRHMNGYPRY